MNFDQWEIMFPEAASVLTREVLAATVKEARRTGDPCESESMVQCRRDISRQGGFSWRNNVGATPAQCDNCGAIRQPVRYGLANESKKLNEKLKSSDLILAIPRIIRPEDVGTVIPQFGSVEVKKAGWKGARDPREKAQAAWLALVTRLRGFACFSTGSVDLGPSVARFKDL